MERSEFLDMPIDDFINFVYHVMDDRVVNMYWVPPSLVGLDKRSAWQIFISRECIIVPYARDETFRTYGGFDSVEPYDRQELGNYVIYNGHGHHAKAVIDYFYENFERIADILKWDLKST